jgi:hypothetical protein
MNGALCVREKLEGDKLVLTRRVDKWEGAVAEDGERDGTGDREGKKRCASAVERVGVNERQRAMAPMRVGGVN